MTIIGVGCETTLFLIHTCGAKEIEGERRRQRKNKKGRENEKQKKNKGNHFKPPITNLKDLMVKITLPLQNNKFCTVPPI